MHILASISFMHVVVAIMFCTCGNISVMHIVVAISAMDLLEAVYVMHRLAATSAMHAIVAILSCTYLW